MQFENQYLIRIRQKTVKRSRILSDNNNVKRFRDIK